MDRIAKTTGRDDHPGHCPAGPGWVGDWHENPRPQWIIPLSGRWFVESMDGHRVEMGPGDISLGEDQNTRPRSDGKQGHLSGTVGDEPAVLMLIQLATLAQVRPERMPGFEISDPPLPPLHPRQCVAGGAGQRLPLGRGSGVDGRRGLPVVPGPAQRSHPALERRTGRQRLPGARPVTPTARPASDRAA